MGLVVEEAEEQEGYRREVVVHSKLYRQCWNYSYVRIESNTSVDTAYVRKTTYGRTCSAVWDT